MALSIYMFTMVRGGKGIVVIDVPNVLHVHVGQSHYLLNYPEDVVLPYALLDHVLIVQVPHVMGHITAPHGTSSKWIHIEAIQVLDWVVQKWVAHLFIMSVPRDVSNVTQQVVGIHSLTISATVPQVHVQQVHVHHVHVYAHRWIIASI
jgi:hypothetical protein